MSWWDRQLKTFFKGGVNVDTPADGDLLQYDSTAGEWVNAALNSSTLLSWQDWTPTYTASGSMTFTSVTTSFARYAQFGKLVFVQLRAFGTTGGTASNFINATTPVTPAVDVSILAGNVSDGTPDTLNTGAAIARTSGIIRFQKPDAANFTLGANRYINAGGFYEVA